MKQTSIEWLVDQMFRQGYFDGNKPLSITNLDHLQQQAKEIYKQEIEDAYAHGQNNGYMYRDGKALIISKESYYELEHGGKK